jgi:hypothetical protein
LVWKHSAGEKYIFEEEALAEGDRPAKKGQ